MNKSIILENYKEGTEFIIKSRPSFWSSTLNSNSPFYNKIKYPYRARIVAVDINEEDHISMTDGVYGWSLSTLVIENKISSITEIRKLKLKKIDGTNLNKSL